MLLCACATGLNPNAHYFVYKRFPRYAPIDAAVVAAASDNTSSEHTGEIRNGRVEYEDDDDDELKYLGAQNDICVLRLLVNDSAYTGTICVDIDKSFQTIGS